MEWIDSEKYYFVREYIKKHGEEQSYAKEPVAPFHYPYWEIEFKNKKLGFSWHSCGSHVYFGELMWSELEPISKEFKELISLIKMEDK